MANILNLEELRMKKAVVRNRNSGIVVEDSFDPSKPEDRALARRGLRELTKGDPYERSRRDDHED